jgi:hypothetical protein
MITGNKLDIFNSLRIDTNLPKFNKELNKSSNNYFLNGENTFATNGINRGDNGITIDQKHIIREFRKSSIDYLSYLKSHLDSGENIPILTKAKYYAFIYFTSLFVKSRSKEIVTKYEYTIEEFFKTIKDSKLEITKTKDILEKYEKVLLEAQKNGQTSLVEKLLKLKDVISSETLLIEKGATKYVTEEQVVKLHKSTDKSKNLKLTYIDNYIRVIPSEVIKLKDIANDMMVFDNYVILHYDPMNNSTDLTEKQKVEEEKKKDPILFGVIQNSRKLYFIGDWTDEFCDLTLDKMMEIISDKGLDINNKSVISYINKI